MSSQKKNPTNHDRWKQQQQPPNPPNEINHNIHNNQNHNNNRRPLEAQQQQHPINPITRRSRNSGSSNSNSSSPRHHQQQQQHAAAARPMTMMNTNHNNNNNTIVIANAVTVMRPPTATATTTTKSGRNDAITTKNVVGNTNKKVHSHRTIEDDSNSNSNSNNNNDVPESQLYSYLVSLSSSCRKHYDTAHSNNNNNESQYQYHNYDYDDNNNTNDDQRRIDPNDHSKDIVQQQQSLSSSLSFCIPITDAPKYCYDAIMTLQNTIVPHIEKTFHNENMYVMYNTTKTTTTLSSSSNNINNNIHQYHTILLHLCDFYKDILHETTTTTTTTMNHEDNNNNNSNNDENDTRTTTTTFCFCPQSIHLLLHPQQILPRVYLLFQALIAQQHGILRHCNSSSSSSRRYDSKDRSSSSSSSSVSTATGMMNHTFWSKEYVQGWDTICCTIAHLINHIPQFDIVQCMIRDFIYLCKDLAIYNEIIKKKQNVTVDTATGSTLPRTMYVTLFEETIDSIDWTKNVPPSSIKNINDSVDDIVDPTSMIQKPVYKVQLTATCETISIVQWYILVIIQYIFTLNHQTRTKTTYTNSIIYEVMDPIHFYGSTCMMNANPDLYIMYHIPHINDLRTLLLSFRQIIVFQSLPATNTKPITQYHLLNIVSRIFKHLQSDWHRSYVPSFTLLQEVAILIGLCIRSFYRILPMIPINESDDINYLTKSTIHNLICLLSNFIYHPPTNVVGTMTRNDIITNIHIVTFHILCESIQYIPTTVMNITNDHTLPLALLRTILMIVQNMTTAATTTNIFNDEFIGCLLLLFHNPIFSNEVTFILNAIFSNRGLSCILDLDTVIGNMTQQPFRPSEVDPQLSIGSKRRSLTEHPDNTDRHPDKRIKYNNLGENSQTYEHTNVIRNDLLSLFDTNLYDTISRMKETFQRPNVDIKDTVLHDLGALYRPFCLLLLIVSSSRRETMQQHGFDVSCNKDNVCQFVKEMLGLLLVVSDRLFQMASGRLHQDDARNILIQIIEQTVISGIYIEQSTWLDEVDIDDLRKVRHSIMVLGHQFMILPLCYNESKLNATFDIPSSFHGVLYGFGLQNEIHKSSEKYHQLSYVMNAEFMMISATINAQKLNNVVVHWTSPILKPNYDDAQVQNFRLDLLARSLQSNTVDTAVILDDVQRRTVETLQQTQYEQQSNSIYRLILWQTIAWTTQSLTSEALHRLGQHRMSNGKLLGTTLINFLIDTSFSDPDPTILDYTSRELGCVLSINNFVGVLSLLSNDQDMVQSQKFDFLSVDKPNPSTFRIFLHIDEILNELQNKTQPPVSDMDIQDHDTMGLEVSKELFSNKIDISRHHRSAARSLCSFLNVDQESIVSSQINAIVKSAMIRVVRQWSTLQHFVTRHVNLNGLYFAELMRVAYNLNVGPQILEDNWLTIAPVLVRDLFSPFSKVSLEGGITEKIEVRPGWKERQYAALSTFIQVLLAGGDLINSYVIDVPYIEYFVNRALAPILSEFVVEKNYFGLQMMASYKIFIHGQQQSENKLRKRHESVLFHNELISGFVTGDVSKYLTTRIWNRDLEKQARVLCLAPSIIEQMIPPIFMKSGLEELEFFTNIVLQNKMTLKQIVATRDILMLKHFVLKLGRSPELCELIVEAMKKAAILRSNEFDERNMRSIFNSNAVRVDSDAAVSWVTTNFMYILVNIVQLRWSTKTIAQQLESLISLFTVLDFLDASDASQYLPQVMATVNAALTDSSTLWTGLRDRSLSSQLQLLAVLVLAKFVKLVAKSQIEALGNSLTSVVVALIPIFTNFEKLQDPLGQESKCHRQSVSLLEWLSSQERLTPHFAEIPFLPQTASLRSVRARLKSRGVQFDNIINDTTHIMLDANATSRTVTSDSVSAGGDSRGAAATASVQAALRRRLEMVTPLIDNDSASVRRVALEHLTSLLRSNREHFHSLIENEGTTSLKRFVTVTYKNKYGTTRWNITDFVHSLLSRCIKEQDPSARVLLATCFGEVGAINANLFEETKPSNDNYYRTVPPWHSTPYKYGLQMVTGHLVTALKSAPSSNDQFKIAFSIQQLLALLNEAAKAGLLMSSSTDLVQNNVPSEISERRLSSNSNHIDSNKPRMDDSLIRILINARAYDVVEPFWYSEFHESEFIAPKPPPVFQISPTFYSWLSNWVRFLVHRSHQNRKTEWTSVFYACRTALRTPAGVDVADHLLPLLVLDCLCFGNSHDRSLLLTEMRDVLTFNSNCDVVNEIMPLTDRRKAVSTVFAIIDALQHWIEPESDMRYSRRLSRSPGQGRESPIPSSSSSDWQQHEAAMRVEEMITLLPLYLRGSAAFSVGMHANALRSLEMASRLSVVGKIFGSEVSVDSMHKQTRSRAAGTCPEEATTLFKDVLVSLNDYETLSALVDENVWATVRTRTIDSIRQKEALQDWQGALLDYERAQQLNTNDATLRIGILRCLLELGHYDSVLQQVNFIKMTESQDDAVNFTDAVPLAVEASWRLGRWDTLSELVGVETPECIEPDAFYQMNLGRTFLHLQRKDLVGALASLTNAKSAVMDGLGNVALENYSRSYGHVLKLHAIREIEDVAQLLCNCESLTLGQYTNDPSMGWNSRIELVSTFGATSLMTTRLALARLSNDAAYEGSLFLRMGKRSRKIGLLGAAANAISQAETAFLRVDGHQKAELKSTLQLQSAKLKYDGGEISVALRMLGQEDIETMGDLEKDQLVKKSCSMVLRNLGIVAHSMDEKDILNIFVRSALQSTRWMIDGGLKEGAAIVARFRLIHCLAPNFEKGHFQFAKYVDCLLQLRIIALQGKIPDHLAGNPSEKIRDNIVSRDKACIRYVTLAVKHYAEALVLDVKHVYQALPRLLSLWFDFTSIPGDKNSVLAEKGSSPETTSFLSSNQDEINAFMALTYRKISAQALYTAIPQLISRITHDDYDTASVVQAILRRVLTKYPAQAMWPLAWIRQSRDPQRKQIGIDIFSMVTDALVKSESLHKLLVTSKTLIDYLYALAKKEVGDKIKDSMRVKPLSDDVDLCEFVPPIQAALSASLVSGDSSRSRDIFPRHIPRMRMFDDIVGVMTSKARPKKVRVFVVAADSIAQLRSGRMDCKEYDIGEIHFLLKEEAKGDLRKDARVQDLNNVVNRIMSSMDKSTKGALLNTRRLHLRTFCVTCLSEETGLLEWVPHTASLRSMISKTYNPQADVTSGKRHGKRITNFTDPQMRTKFENICQAAFFVSGDLTKAAELFERECLAVYPPILYWWYILQFPDPHAWYEARTRFALSTAAWSAVGHVIGLGDRHSENILLDKTSGECVHVDFDCIFDKGLHLPKPEVVPFRLTQNMVDALGPTGADGMYSYNLKAAMSTLRDNRDTLLSVLEPFVKDPVINWKRYRSQQRTSYRAADHDPTIEAKQKMSIIDERLRGIYNLRNTNLKKVRQVDRLESQQDDELSHPIPLSVEGQVHKMIAEATSTENLVQLYVGWMPWV